MMNNSGPYQPSATTLARATHALTRVLITLLVSLVALLPALLSNPVGAATTAAVKVSDAADAMAPLDTSSPRATLRSFLTLSEAVARRYQDYRDAPSRETQAALYMRVRRAAELLDPKNRSYPTPFA